MSHTYSVLDLVESIHEPPATHWLNVFAPAATRIGLHHPGRPIYIRGYDWRTREYLDILTSARDQRWPVDLTVNQANDEIVDVQVPLVALVEAIAEGADGTRHVSLRPSPLRYRLSPRHPQFDSILRTLELARVERTLVAVTDDIDEPEILGAQQAPLGVDALGLTAGLLPPALTPAAGEQALPSEAKVIADLTMVPEADLQDLFDAMKSAGCGKFIAPNERLCIPFSYPDNGCHARAHRMCELLHERNIVAGKVWSFGQLRVDTPNSPLCAVEWEFHVAPVIKTTIAGAVTILVLDPSLFRTPVTQRDWLRKQNDPSAKSRLTPSAVWDGRLGQEPTFDSSFEFTPRDLGRDRARLRRRTIKRGAPPYCG